MKTTPAINNSLSVAPDGLPMLSAGRHLVPSDGACFMEFASVLAGEPFTDHPRCTHPLLAELARRVNDNVDDDTRQHLLPLVPEVVGVRGRGPGMTAAIVAEVVLDALGLEPDSTQLRRACRRARRRARAGGPRNWWTRITDPAYRCGSSVRAIACAVDTVHRVDPSALRALLADAIDAARDAQRASGGVADQADGGTRNSGSHAGSRR